MLAREAPIHLGHHRARLLVAHEDRADRGGIVERVEDAAGVATRHAEHEFDPGFLEHVDERVGDVDLGGGHGAVLRKCRAAVPGTRAITWFGVLRERVR